MDPTKPEPYDLHLDLSDIKIVNLHPEQVASYSKTRPGYKKAIECLLRLSPELIERVGVNPATLGKAQEFLSTDGRCDEVFPAAEKLVELVHETRLNARHELAGIIGEVAAMARRRSERDPKGAEILAALQELLDYHYGPAAKALATKEKAKAAEKAKEAGTPKPGGSATALPTTQNDTP
jgi:hypothetical protein